MGSLNWEHDDLGQRACPDGILSTSQSLFAHGTQGEFRPNSDLDYYYAVALRWLAIALKPSSKRVIGITAVVTCRVAEANQ
jgi:hypothetical protein